MSLLSIKNLDVVYNKVITALSDVSLDIEEGEIVAVLGSNGAGKSSLLKTISGLVKASSGSIMYDGKELTKMAPNQILKEGIAQVPEGRMIVPHFSVKENLVVGAHVANRKTIGSNLDMVFSLFPILKERYGQSAGTLSGGEQQMLAIGRALMSNPKILLLDEPSLGLAPVIVDKVMELVSTINKEKGITILLIEQNAFIALETSNRAYVLENGRVTMSGLSSELISNPELKSKYLAG